MLVNNLWIKVFSRIARGKILKSELKNLHPCFLFSNRNHETSSFVVFWGVNWCENSFLTDEKESLFNHRTAVDIISFANWRKKYQLLQSIIILEIDSYNTQRFISKRNNILVFFPKHKVYFYGKIQIILNFNVLITSILYGFFFINCKPYWWKKSQS